MDGLTLDAALDTVSALLLLASAVLTLAAGVGLIRFGDALSRLHAATKPQVLGLVCVLLAVAIEERTWTVALFAIPVLFLQVLTTPMAAHMVGRAAYRTGNFRTDLITLDELGPAIEAAGHTAPEGVAPSDREADGRRGTVS